MLDVSLPPDATSDVRLPENWRLPLGGCDRYLHVLEQQMAESGQGRHVGITILELSDGFDDSKFRAGIARFTAAYPILFSRVHRSWFAGIPEWRPVPPTRIWCRKSELILPVRFVGPKKTGLSATSRALGRFTMLRRDTSRHNLRNPDGVVASLVRWSWGRVGSQ